MKLQNVIQISILIACLGLLPRARAVSPPPDGGYPNFTTAEGDHALQALTSGVGNTAIGTFSLFSVTTGSFNTALGAGALDLNTADENTATGAAALLFNTTGTENTANGTAALEFNDTGDFNTANGAFALFSNTIGAGNTAIGREALLSITGGNSNTAIGVGALISSTGSSNTALGVNAGIAVTTASNVICLGSPGRNVDNSCFIGNIRNRATQIPDAIPILIDSNQQLGTASSSRRFKREIKPMDKASETILALKPVAFHYKSDKTNTPQFGLIAEEVAEVNPDLVVRDENGEIYTVRYEAVNAMLLNEFLKEHRKVEQQDANIAKQQTQIDALTAGLQKVSAQLEARKPATQVANNP